MKKRLFCLLLGICLCALPACQAELTPEEPAPSVAVVEPLEIDSGELISKIFANATPGEPSTVDPYADLVGSVTPVENLPQASTRFVGETLEIKLLVFRTDPIWYPTFIVYNPAKDPTAEHVTLFMKGYHAGQFVLLRLQTAYGSPQAFCAAFDGRITGTVTDVRIICEQEQFLLLNGYGGNSDVESDGSRYVLYNGQWDTTVSFLTEEEWRGLAVLHRIYERFGITALE